MRESIFHMKIVHNTITLHALFGNIIRSKHILIVLRDEQGKYILGEKPQFYPKGIVRFVGGGVNTHESWISAAIREIQEELQLDITKERLTALAQVRTQGEFDGKVYHNTTRLYELTLSKQEVIHPSDDISSVVYFDRKELQALVSRYKHLREDQWYVKDHYRHCWKDYGEMYSRIHEVALNCTR